MPDMFPHAGRQGIEGIARLSVPAEQDRALARQFLKARVIEMSDIIEDVA